MSSSYPFPASQVYCILDYETFSAAELKKVGAFEYSKHETTDILCVAWRVGTREELRDAKIHTWSPIRDGVSFGKQLINLGHALSNTSIIKVAHNALFEQVITQQVLKPKYLPGMPPQAPEHWLCTASLASSIAIPRSLDGASKVLNLPFLKDKDGHRLMLKMSKPRKPTKNDLSERHLKPEDMGRLVEYCVADVEAETHLFLKCPPLTPTERKVWCLDQKINLRGFAVDRDLVITTLKMIGEETDRILEQTREETFGLITSPNQVGAIRDLLNSYGVSLPDLQAPTVEEALASGLATGSAETLLRLRQAASKTSTAKYSAFEMRSRSDGRLRDILVYHTATTGRWGGAGVQPQNFPRGSVPDSSIGVADVLKYGDLELVRMMYGQPMDAFSTALRAMIIAPRGKVLDVADYNAIEARVLFWVAEHEDGVKAFKEDKPIYKLQAADIFSIPVEKVTDEQRFLGKQAILGCLAKDTPVMTSKGWCPIQSITQNDSLWDGRQWVKSDGAFPQGMKTVIRISDNVESTPDHWFWAQNMWVTAVEFVNMKPHVLDLCSDSSQLPVRSLKSGMNAVSMCAAYAEMKKRLELTNCGQEKISLVQFAQTLSMAKRVGTPGEIATLLVTEGLEHVGTRVMATLKNAATTHMIKTTTSMVVEAFDSPSTPDENLWNTLLHWMGLTNPGSPSTELIMTGTMSPEIYESSLKALTTRTEETFDVLNAGPNNCFSIPGVVVHNCGYMMSWKKFKIMCATYGVEISDELAQRAVTSYRETHWPVPVLWSNLERAAIAAVESPGVSFSINKTTWVCKSGFLWCVLPSGRRLAYPQPSVQWLIPPWGGETKKKTLCYYGVNNYTKKWEEQRSYGGLLTENVVQAISRDLMAAAMLRIEETSIWQLVLSVHDELLGERFSSDGDFETFKNLMAETPPWAEGCPIKVAGWSGTRYKK